MGDDRSVSTSSSEEDGDADWRAAIDSVAATTTFSKAHSTAPATNGESVSQEDEIDTIRPQKLKHYQIKAQKTLEDILDKTIEIVKDVDHASQEEPSGNGGGIRLFKRAPPGIVFDHTGKRKENLKQANFLPTPRKEVGTAWQLLKQLMWRPPWVLTSDELQEPRKKPRIRPGKEFEENSKEFKYQIKSIAIDGMDILAASEKACQKSLARLEEREAASKAAAKREEERVAALKKIRGERWLPSVARDMQLGLQRR